MLIRGLKVRILTKSCLETCCHNYETVNQPTMIGSFYFQDNEQVTKYNYDRLIQLNTPVAKIHAIHSSEKIKHISPQDMLGLQPAWPEMTDIINILLYP